MAAEVKIRRDAGDLVGSKEAAQILGVKLPQVSRWNKKGKMPEPVERLSATDVWLRVDIEAKARERQ